MTIRSAELCRGTLVRCGPGVRGVGWPESPTVRAHVIATIFSNENLAVVAQTAAWIWGATWQSELPISLSSFEGKRFLQDRPIGTAVHEYYITQADVVYRGGVSITTPERTIYDLLYIDDAAFELSGFLLIRELLDHGYVVCDDVATEFHHRNRPHTKRAQSRFAELLAISQ